MKRLIGLGAAMLLAACAHDLGLMKKEETLNAYRAAIRWSAFEQAAAFRSRPTPPRRKSEYLGDVRVTGYEIVSEREDEAGLTLYQTVAIHYYRTEDFIERTTMDEQAWHYDLERGKWVIDSALPHFK